MNSDADDRLLAPYRQVRRIERADAPWPGMLVRLASGESVMLVDVREFPGDWEGWRADPEGHILSPRDVVRRRDGHSVALPLCTERLQDFLGRRVAARVPLSAGEVVTIGVSLVRGMAALDSTSSVTGEWWLTDAGRPVLVTDASENEASAHTAELLRDLAASSRDDDVLLSAAGAVGGTRRSAHDLRIAEEQLFSLATPDPLATSLLTPRAARDVFSVDRESARAVDEVDHPSSWVDALARHVDTDLADAVSRATTGVWRTLRSSRSTKRKPWLLAGGAAAVVLTAGLMWPAGQGATADPAGDSETATPAATAAPSASPSAAAASADPAAPVDLVSVADTLIAGRTACAGDSACLGSIMLDPATVIEAGAIDLATDQRKTTLLDDFGGVAVLRVDALEGAQPSQLVVIMREEDRWLLRDVHVAKQP